VCVCVGGGVFRSHHTGQNGNLLITNRSFEIGSKFKYLGKAVIDKNWVREEIKSILKYCTFGAATDIKVT